MRNKPDMRVPQIFHAYQDDMLQDLARLVEIPSVVADPLPGMPYGEAPYKVLLTAAEIAERMGFHTVVSENCCMTADYGDRPNQLSLLAHLDVVDAGSGWTTRPPYALTRESDWVFGRGGADNKGPCVALLYAMLAAKEINPDLLYSPQVWFGTAEEVGSPDLRNYLKHTELAPFALTPDALEPIVIGECAKYRPEFYAQWPQSDALPRTVSLTGGSTRNAIPGHASAIVVGLRAADAEQAAAQIFEQTGVRFTLSETERGLEIQAEGRGAHIGRPELGRNAQTALVALLAALPLADCHSTKALHALNRLFPYDDIAGNALNLTVCDDIFGSTKTNFTVCHMTQTEVRCKIDSRGPLAATPANYSSIIDLALQRAGFTVIPSVMDAAHYVPEDAPLVKRIKDLYETYYENPATCHVSIGASYAHYIEGAFSTGVAAPGIDTMLHKSDERMRIEDLLRIGMMYTQAILDICGENPKPV